jgi:hypothetical protein
MPNQARQAAARVYEQPLGVVRARCGWSGHTAAVRVIMRVAHEDRLRFSRSHIRDNLVPRFPADS